VGEKNSRHKIKIRAEKIERKKERKKEKETRKALSDHPYAYSGKSRAESSSPTTQLTNGLQRENALGVSLYFSFEENARPQACRPPQASLIVHVLLTVFGRVKVRIAYDRFDDSECRACG